MILTTKQIKVRQINKKLKA